MLDLYEVKVVTSYSIGGVPPFPHAEELSVYADKSLTRFSKVWAAAGEPSAVMNVAVVSDVVGPELKRVV